MWVIDGDLDISHNVREGGFKVSLRLITFLLLAPCKHNWSNRWDLTSFFVELVPLSLTKRPHSQCVPTWVHSYCIPFPLLMQSFFFLHCIHIKSSMLILASINCLCLGLNLETIYITLHFSTQLLPCPYRPSCHNATFCFSIIEWFEDSTIIQCMMRNTECEYVTKE